MEVAFQFVQSGLLDIPESGGINVKASRAFLKIAQCLQEHMLWKWASDDVLEVDDFAGLRTAQQILVIIGPGGTGKTTILRMAEALIDFCAGPESVRKCAISNTAARLLKGDKLRALCKLPLEDLQHNMGRLSSKVLRKHRKR